MVYKAKTYALMLRKLPQWLAIMHNYPLTVNHPHVMLIFFGPNSSFMTPTFHDSQAAESQSCSVRTRGGPSFQLLKNTKGRRVYYFPALPQFKIIHSKNSTSSTKQGNDNRMASWVDRELFFSKFLILWYFFIKKTL